MKTVFIIIALLSTVKLTDVEKPIPHKLQEKYSETEYLEQVNRIEIKIKKLEDLNK
jgi:hypothetical protein